MNLEALAEQLASKWFFLAKPSSAEVLAALIKVRDAERERCAGIAKAQREEDERFRQTGAIPTQLAVMCELTANQIEAAIRKGE